jgi:hypothetical protein
MFEKSKKAILEFANTFKPGVEGLWTDQLKEIADAEKRIADLEFQLGVKKSSDQFVQGLGSFAYDRPTATVSQLQQDNEQLKKDLKFAQDKGLALAEQVCNLQDKCAKINFIPDGFVWHPCFGFIPKP